ncbi:maltase A3 [Drosophila grimshawi]|uniref:alpha-glucosidase n=1 Tax=Drosophila grimshawi TaxID=7222 RepID=B4J5X1_DROGR|nr:maltase A3 [Drosophila grimshawi]EDW00814.1 GH21092 [Drosophila grimshawi]
MTTWFGIVLLVGLGFLAVNATAPWWQTASFYQIYPRSFKDSDGNGVGDLNGVTEKLEYLKEIGVTATWLSPFLLSPMADFGYDIADFKEVDPLFGTMEDFENMVSRAKQLNVKIILDFVPNHSSDDCDWFIRSAAGEEKYKDYYIWHPGFVENGVRRPPSNWVSVFRGSAWEWHEGRQEYYLHQFHKKQPDFNFRNPVVREEMNDVLRFWLEKGVDGFRVDAIYHAFEIQADGNGNYPDEPRNDWTNDPDEYGYTHKIYTVDQPETPHLVYEWREILDQFQADNGGEERILMVETWSPIEVVMHYYGNSTAEGAQIPFNFQLISNLNRDSDAYHYEYLINNWLSLMPNGKSANWVIGNHDKNRVGSRFGADRIDLFNILLLTLPGCSITYQGEEIGMLDGYVSWKDTVDPQACNGYEENYMAMSRDPARTPMQWTDGNMAGFTTGSTTWLPIGQDYAQRNVQTERGAALSHLNVFKKLQQLRKEPAIQQGAADVKAVSHYVLANKRYLSGNYVYISLLNIFDNIENVNLHDVFDGLPDNFQYALVTRKSIKQLGDKVSASSVTLMPYESIVLRSTTTV